MSIPDFMNWIVVFLKKQMSWGNDSVGRTLVMGIRKKSKIQNISSLSISVQRYSTRILLRSLAHWCCVFVSIASRVTDW